MSKFIQFIAKGEEDGVQTKVPVMVNTSEISRVELTPQGVKVVLFREGVSFFAEDKYEDLRKQLLDDAQMTVVRGAYEK